MLLWELSCESTGNIMKDHQDSVLKRLNCLGKQDSSVPKLCKFIRALDKASGEPGPGAVLGPQPGAEGDRTRVGCTWPRVCPGDRHGSRVRPGDPAQLQAWPEFAGAPRSRTRGGCVWEPSWDWPWPLRPFGALKALTAVACSPSDNFPLFY